MAGYDLTLTCNILLDPSVDSAVMVNSTWTAPGGATLNGSNPSWTGSSYQSTLRLTSLEAGNAENYTCSAVVLPSNYPFIMSSSEVSSSILGLVENQNLDFENLYVYLIQFQDTQ